MASAYDRCASRWRILGPIPSHALLVALSLCLAEAALADSRKIPTRIAAYDQAPVIVQAATTELVETYEDPNDVLLRTVTNGRARPQPRVRYANRMNQEVAVLRMEGALTVKNASLKTVEAMQITTILLSAFQERLGSQTEFIKGPLPPFRTLQIGWSRGAPNEKVYELYVVVTKIRFSDGEIWAPTEELILSPGFREFQGFRGHTTYLGYSN